MLDQQVYVVVMLRYHLTIKFMRLYIQIPSLDESFRFHYDFVTK